MRRLILSIVVVFAACSFPLLASSQKSMIGQPLPKLSLDYVKAKPELEGKPLIVEFWATWCPPCRDSIPHLNEIYAKYKGQGLEIIGVTDEDNPTIKAFTKKIPIDYNAATDRGGKLGQAFAVQGIPHAVLVSKEGKIVWEGHPMSLKPADIEKILK